MNANLHVPAIHPDETLDDYVARAFGDKPCTVTLVDGTNWTGPTTFETARLVASIQKGCNDESWSAFPTDRPWFEFRTGDVADIAVAEPI